MNEQLIKFIEFCLVDGLISDKEREVIFRKSKELGVPDDECEIILEGMISQYNKEDKKEVKDDINKDIDIKESYLNLDTPQDWMTNLNTINEKIVNYLNNRDEKFITFVKSGGLKNILKKSPFVHGKHVLDDMINQPHTGLLFEGRTTLERKLKKRIEHILTYEEFWGYSITPNYIEDIEGLNKIIKDQNRYNFNNKDFWKKWTFSIWTNLGLYTFERKYKDFLLSDDVIEMEEFDSYLSLSNKDVSTSGCKRFMFTYSDDFKVTPLISNLKLSFDDELFIKTTSSLNTNNEDLSSLMRIHNFITRSINEHNIGIDNLNISNIYDIDKIVNEQECYYTDYCSVGKIKNVINYQKEFILFMTNLLMMRDNLLNCLIKSDPVNSKKIILKFEDLGILKTKFERDLLNSLKDISNQLSQLNKNIMSITETLTDHLQSIENKLETQSDQLEEISGQLTYNNLISTINTYQVWKINQKSKLSLDEN